jgi:hypothetical protein
MLPLPCRAARCGKSPLNASRRRRVAWCRRRRKRFPSAMPARARLPPCRHRGLTQLHHRRRRSSLLPGFAALVAGMSLTSRPTCAFRPRMYLPLTPGVMPGNHHDLTANTFEVNYELEKRDCDFVAVGGLVGSEFANHKPGRKVAGTIHYAASGLRLLRSSRAPAWKSSGILLRGQREL